MKLDTTTLFFFIAVAIVVTFLMMMVNAVPHQREASPLHRLIVLMFGFLALICVGGGIYAIVAKAESKTEFSILGARLTTGHVGVAFVGIGLVIAYFTIRAVLKSQRDLAALPLDRIKKKAR